MNLKILNLTLNDPDDYLTVQGVYPLTKNNEDKVIELYAQAEEDISSENLIRCANKLAQLALKQNTSPMVSNSERGVLLDPPHYFTKYLEKAILSVGLSPVYFINNKFYVIKEKVILDLQTDNFINPENLTLEDFKNLKLLEMKTKYDEEINKGTNAFAPHYPEIVLSIREESIIRFQGIIEACKQNGKDVVPFVYDIDTNKLTDVPIKLCMLALNNCFGAASILYDRMNTLKNKIQNCFSKEELDKIVWEIDSPTPTEEEVPSDVV